MNKTTQISKHEFIKMIRSKGFIIVTLLFPMLALLALGGYTMVNRMGAESNESQVVNIGYVDEAGGFNSINNNEEIIFTNYESTAKATEALLAGNIDEYFIIPEDYMLSGIVRRFTLEQELELPGNTIRAVRNFLLSNILQEQTSSEILERAKSPAGFISTRLDEAGQISTEQGGLFGAFLIPYLFGILFWIAILMSSSTLLEGLSEEKENRIMEILISSVSTKQLIIGKIIGLGIAGLLQILFWFISASFIAGLVSESVGGIFSNLEIPMRLIAFGAGYFILGYLLFSVLFSLIGAIVPTYREGQQLSMLLIPLGVIPLIIIPFFTENPTHPLTYFLTFFPISAPVTSMIRIGLGNIPYWQLVLTIIVIIISIIGLILISARVFRAFLLMYGKRPNLKEIMRSIRQA
ncbi:MAG: ABC transporter permease [Dehalococcoidales bacterium]|nr:ABC transporter permease [Dehalococcoidales bacterium]